ncbi:MULTISPECIES: DUF6888 family protein [Microcystis]|uniref:DUF6888 family protein n=1 Tax=Microcystis TaxID=1125 RepID=UPI00352BAA35
MIDPIKPSSVNESHIVEKFTKLFLDRKILLSLFVSCLSFLYQPIYLFRYDSRLKIIYILVRSLIL